MITQGYVYMIMLLNHPLSQTCWVTALYYKNEMSNVKASIGVVAKMKEVTLRTSVSPCPVFSIFQHPVLELKEAKAKLQRGNIHL